ncbi:Sentrin-specific protease [Hondaea fermentalgiana]|uniref:Sentrin-specific protease n=1 Tax=Hondaea fermentalgiana TaxID=2315210 RepID=A0A2R5GAI2_9STRA|nr:Sentrin-specific protease [Hondaea fermentalgiana]|eukprot:GBG25563.1 Sentrin-specific protease [Hondaea fermentalgiana]
MGGPDGDAAEPATAAAPAEDAAAASGAAARADARGEGEKMPEAGDDAARAEADEENDDNEDQKGAGRKRARGKASARPSLARARQDAQPSGLRRSSRARKTRFSAAELAEHALGNDGGGGDGDEYAGVGEAYGAYETHGAPGVSNEEALRIALDRSKRETSGRRGGRAPQRLIQPPCVQFVRKHQQEQQHEKDLLHGQQSPSAGAGVTNLVQGTSEATAASACPSLATTVDLTADSDDEQDLADPSSDSKGAKGLLSAASYANGSAATAATAAAASGSAEKKLSVSFLRGELVSTNLGLGTVQDIFKRHETTRLHVQALSTVETALPSQDDKHLIVASNGGGLVKGDRILCENRDAHDMHTALGESTDAASALGALQIDRLTPFTVYEVWLQWGDAEPAPLLQSSANVRKTKTPASIDLSAASEDPENNLASPKRRRTLSGETQSGTDKDESSRANAVVRAKEDKTDYSIVWMPKAYLRDNMQRASACQAVKYKMPVPFGAYGPRNRSITLTADDVARVWPGLHLNDAILDYWIGHILARVDPARLDNIYVFHSLFFHWFEQQVSNLGASAGYSCVANTTKNIDIFAKDILVIPINAHLHWTLAIVCNPGLLGEAVSKSESFDTPEENGIDAASRSPSRAPSPATPKVESLAETMEDTAANEANDKAERTKELTGNLEANDVEMTSADASEGKMNNVTLTAADAKNVGSSKSESLDAGPSPVQESSFPETTSKPAPEAKRRPYVIFLDSLRGNQTQRVTKLLRQYLEQEWIARRGPLNGTVDADALPGFSPIVPTQQNQCDCGVYLLEYISRILTEKLDRLFHLVSDDTVAPRKMRTVVNGLFGKNWFNARDVAKTRAEILRSLKNEAASQVNQDASDPGRS